MNASQSYRICPNPECDGLLLQEPGRALGFMVCPVCGTEVPAPQIFVKAADVQKFFADMNELNEK